MGEEILMSAFVYLDLDVVDLLGWEMEKSAKTVDAIIQGIEAGDGFPPVHVLKIDTFTYHLSAKHQSRDQAYHVDGGHNRAIGHYIAKKPLKCIIDRRSTSRNSTLVNIRDVELPDDIFYQDVISDYASRKAKFPNYR